MHLSRIDFCCGVYHFADFDNENDSDENSDHEMYEALLERMNEDRPGFWYQAFFKKRRRHDGTYDDEYEHLELMDMIEALPGCIKLPETINPNSGNKLQGYLWQKQGA
jgi:hypothetical protein